MNPQVLWRKIFLVLLLGAPMLLGGCVESYRWEEENLNRIVATQDQTLAEAKATNGKADALNERLDRQLSQRK